MPTFACAGTAIFSACIAALGDVDEGSRLGFGHRVQQRVQEAQRLAVLGQGFGVEEADQTCMRRQNGK